ncbi:MAG TPA: H-X9-DG-CTERM domain-containing protein [Pirellulales bacterium]|jgi:prepilin-type processing-associated H-X9-DG protein|nr:H-X9-DG-CTERM domain-containing protein [Pirellulales bacterium]
MVIEVDAEHAVPWMSPIDADEKIVLGIGPDSKLSHPGGVSAAFVDGHIQTLYAEVPAAQRRALISIAAGDKADPDGAE